MARQISRRPPRSRKACPDLSLRRHRRTRRRIMVPTPQTPFTRDILGNYVCNTFSEAQNSGPFDVVIIGGGTFGVALAQDLLFRTQRQGPGSVAEDGIRPAGFRVLVLEAGPFALPE